MYLSESDIRILLPRFEGGQFVVTSNIKKTAIRGDIQAITFDFEFPSYKIIVYNTWLLTALGSYLVPQGWNAVRQPSITMPDYSPAYVAPFFNLGDVTYVNGDSSQSTIRVQVHNREEQLILHPPNHHENVDPRKIMSLDDSMRRVRKLG